MSNITVSGPMFEPASSPTWKSVTNKPGWHYNVFGVTHPDIAMDGLRELFDGGTADELNVCLFSTSGVHGSYRTIEDADAIMARGNVDEEGNPTVPKVTFLVVHPRLVTLRHGNCVPKNAEDIAFLKQLRQTSWDALAGIGRAEGEGT